MHKYVLYILYSNMHVKLHDLHHTLALFPLTSRAAIRIVVDAEAPLHTPHDEYLSSTFQERTWFFLRERIVILCFDGMKADTVRQIVLDVE